MRSSCERERATLRGNHLLTQPDQQTLDVLEEPDACREFREQHPDEFMTLVGNTISGTVTLHDDDLFVIDSGSLKGACSGRGGYDDISGGLDVVVKDGAGAIIAKDELWSGFGAGYNECLLPFQVTHVPTVDFYEIAVGRRGSLVFSHTELEADEWYVGFQIGE